MFNITQHIKLKGNKKIPSSTNNNIGNKKLSKCKNTYILIHSNIVFSESYSRSVKSRGLLALLKNITFFFYL